MLHYFKSKGNKYAKIQNKEMLHMNPSKQTKIRQFLQCMYILKSPFHTKLFWVICKSIFSRKLLSTFGFLKNSRRTSDRPELMKILKKKLLRKPQQQATIPSGSCRSREKCQPQNTWNYHCWKRLLIGKAVCREIREQNIQNHQGKWYSAKVLFSKKDK